MKSLKKILSAALVSASVACPSVNAAWFASGFFTNASKLLDSVTYGALSAGFVGAYQSPDKVSNAVEILTGREFSEDEIQKAAIAGGTYSSASAFSNSVAYYESKAKDDQIENLKYAMNRQACFMNNQYNSIGRLQYENAQLRNSYNQLYDANIKLKDANVRLNNALLVEDVE